MNVRHNSTEPINLRVTSFDLMMTNEQPVLGLLQSQWSIELAKSGLPHQSVATSITEIGNGVYRVQPIASHRDTIGESCWVFSFNVTISGREIWDIIVVERVSHQLAEDTDRLPRSATLLTPGICQHTIANGESLPFNYTSAS